jgi:putative colanic acid biosysnthesis UDP-glucose lipid carrier transferase
MTTSKIGRYSKYIRPISILMDLMVISFLAYFLFSDLNLNIPYYIIYLNIGWVLTAVFLKFYAIFRFTKTIEIISKIIKQGIIFLLIVIAFFPFYDQAVFNSECIVLFIVGSLVLITISKFFLFYCLKKYRLIVGSNFRYAVIVGYTPESIQLKELFETRKEYGYQFLGYFSDKKINKEIKGNLLDLKTFALTNQVDEIYCSLNEVSNVQLKDLLEFADENNKTIKFIPDTKDIFSKNLKIDYYDFFPVLSLKETLLNEPVIKIFKRFFDIVFSLTVIIGILSWLAPLLAILIKLESKGPILFKQGRPGIGEKQFYCYKFRSMRMNGTTETEALKNDPRVTKIGKLMRKSSIDEMPQFVNVLLGDMSVVGPRPHLWSQNKIYGSKIKKYMVRHYVKPEIETEKDMINRIKMDVFYIENWSLILDLKIIYLTVVNILKGDKKAY